MPENLTACRRWRRLEPTRPPRGGRGATACTVAPDPDGGKCGSPPTVFSRRARPSTGLLAPPRGWVNGLATIGSRATTTSTGRVEPTRPPRGGQPRRAPGDGCVEPANGARPPDSVHTQPPFRDEAMDDDNGNPALAAELAPNRNAQRSPAPPSQALEKLHPADGEAAFARVEQSIEQLPSTVRALELRDGLRACLGLWGAADRNWSAERCPSVGVCLQPPSFQVFGASVVVACGPWSLDSRVDVCGAPRGFRHRTEAVVHRALRGLSADSDFSRPVHCFRPTVHCLARSGQCWP